MPPIEESLGSQSPNQIPSNPLGRAGKKTIRILISESHPMIRDGLRALLETKRGFRVVGEAADGEATIDLVRRFEPDVLLLDMTIPRNGAIEVMRQLTASRLKVRVLVLTSDIGTNETVQALNLGASGLLSKNSPSTMLFEGIQRVIAGEYWISPDCITNLIERLRHTPTRITPQNTQFGLTTRELEIIMEVISGCSNPEIAEKLSLSEQTVKHHLTHIFDKLGVYSRVELALFAVNHKLCGAADAASE